MASGILELVGRAGTVVVVTPIFVLALDFLTSGRVVGGLAFLGIIGVILAIERYVITPGDLLERAVGDAVSAAVVEPSEEE